MFPNEKMEDPQTWNDILAAMLSACATHTGGRRMQRNEQEATSHRA